MFQDRKRRKEDGPEQESSPSHQLLPPIAIPEVDNYGPLFRTDLLRFGGGDDPDAGGFKPEPIQANLGFHAMGGLEHLVDEVKTRILFPILNADFVTRHGRYPPKGILLHGPPGTGKTMFAKCLAAELSKCVCTQFTFFMRRGSDMMSCWVGSSEKNIRQIFAKAAQCKPSILFFDEADSAAPNRATLQSTVPVYTNVVTTILAEMDKIVRGEVIVIFATNRLDAIDPAIKRPGRCDVILPFYPPNEEGRKKIIQIYTQSWGDSRPQAKILEHLAHKTNGFTGADIDKLCSEAFFSCIRRTQAQNGDFTVSKVSTSERINEQDWLVAINTMRPSKGNVFGSYIQVLDVADFIQPLIQSSVQSLVTVMKPNLPQESFITAAATTGGPNCILAWNPCSKSDDILDAFIVPSVLSHLPTHTLYILNEETMLQEFKFFSMNAIIGICKEAKNCSKSAVLFIPRLEKLVTRLGGEADILRKLLFDTANKSVLVLATAGCDIGGLHPGLRPLFDGQNRVFRLEKPNESERHEFYGPVFRAIKKSEELLRDAVALTDHEDMWSMITLHRELSLVLEAASSSESCKKGETLGNARGIIDSYRKCRLSSCRK